MNNPKPLYEIINNLYQSSRIFIHQQVKHHNLTPTQWQVLHHLDQNNGNLTQFQLSQLMKRDLGQLTRLLNKMESESLIRKAIDKKDKRMKHIMLTKYARNKINPIKNEITDFYNKQQQQFTTDEYTNLQNMLTKVLDFSYSPDLTPQPE